MISQLHDLFKMSVLAYKLKSFLPFDAKQINSFPSKVQAGLVYSGAVQKPTDLTK